MFKGGINAVERIFLLIASVVTSLSGCGSVGGTVGAPSLASEDITVVPYNSAEPTFTVLVERVKLSSKNMSSRLIPAEDYLTSMLNSAIGRYPNIRMLDASVLSSANRSIAKEKRVIKVQVLFTELDQYSKIDETGLDPWRYDSGWDYTWKPPISIVAFWVSMLTGLPTVFTTTEISGVVGIDLVATDARTGEVVASFPIHGTHTEKVQQVGNAMFGVSRKTQARSTFSGASRAALNEAARKLYDELRGRYGKAL